MYNIEIWKLATDVLLAGSLIYLCYRISRRPAAASVSLEAQNLEADLRKLVEEAGNSSRSLSVELRKRQQELEKLLFDLGTVEHRVNRAIVTAEERKGELEIEYTRAAQTVTEVRLQAESRPTARPESRLSPERRTEVLITPTPETEQVELYEDMPEPPSFEQAGRIQPEKVRSDRPAGIALNIYGEPVQSAGKSVGLSSRIEKAVEPEVLSEQSAIEDVFAAAEEMLRAGESLQRVAARTDLPLEDLKMLSEVIAREKASAAVTAGHAENEERAVAFSTSDQRLGVLAGIRRQVQVL